MKFLELLEKAWRLAIFLAFALGIFNLVRAGSFSYSVYTPIVCGGFCILIYMNIRRQRIFLQKMKKQQEAGDKGPVV